MPSPVSTPSSQKYIKKKIKTPKLDHSTSQADHITTESDQLNESPESIEENQPKEEIESFINISKSNASKKRNHIVSSDSDSDEAPEVISMIAGKRQAKQKQDEIEKLSKAKAHARRQANRLRDEKLKENSKARKAKLSIDNEINSAENLPSDDQDKQIKLDKINTTKIQNTKKYLDPSLFASASHILEQSKKASKILESEKLKLETSQRKKFQNLKNQNSREIGHNTTVVHLPQVEHISPAPRPISAANFERNRLYTKPTRSRVRLPKSTLAAKEELGGRKLTMNSIQARRALKPAVVFTRS